MDMKNVRKYKGVKLITKWGGRRDARAQIAKPEFYTDTILDRNMDNEVSMIIILPNQVDGLKRVQTNLHQVNLTKSLHRAYSGNIELYLPKFRIETTLDLEDTLKKMGMNHIFGLDANFSGIGNTSLNLSKVVQKAFIEVSEEGTEAVAVSLGSFLYLRSRPRVTTIEVNRPALYIRYNIV